MGRKLKIPEQLKCPSSLFFRQLETSSDPLQPIGRLSAAHAQKAQSSLCRLFSAVRGGERQSDLNRRIAPQADREAHQETGVQHCSLTLRCRPFHSPFQGLQPSPAQGGLTCGIKGRLRLVPQHCQGGAALPPPPVPSGEEHAVSSSLALQGQFGEGRMGLIILPRRQNRF